MKKKSVKKEKPIRGRASVEGNRSKEYGKHRLRRSLAWIERTVRGKKRQPSVEKLLGSPIKRRPVKAGRTNDFGEDTHRWSGVRNAGGWTRKQERVKEVAETESEYVAESEKAWAREKVEKARVASYRKGLHSLRSEFPRGTHRTLGAQARPAREAWISQVSQYEEEERCRGPRRRTGLRIWGTERGENGRPGEKRVRRSRSEVMRVRSKEVLSLARSGHGTQGGEEDLAKGSLADGDKDRTTSPEHGESKRNGESPLRLRSLRRASGNKREREAGRWERERARGEDLGVYSKQYIRETREAMKRYMERVEKREKVRRRHEQVEMHERRISRENGERVGSMREIGKEQLARAMKTHAKTRTARGEGEGLRWDGGGRHARREVEKREENMERRTWGRRGIGRDGAGRGKSAVSLMMALWRPKEKRERGTVLYEGGTSAEEKSSAVRGAVRTAERCAEGTRAELEPREGSKASDESVGEHDRKRGESLAEVRRTRTKDVLTVRKGKSLSEARSGMEETKVEELGLVGTRVEKVVFYQPHVGDLSVDGVPMEARAGERKTHNQIVEVERMEYEESRERESRVAEIRGEFYTGRVNEATQEE